MVYVILMVYYYYLSNSDFNLFKKELDREIDEKLSSNSDRNKYHRMDLDNFKIFRERKIDYIDLIIEEVDLVMKYFLDIIVGLIIAFLISLAGLAYDYLDTLAMEEHQINYETYQSCEIDSSKNIDNDNSVRGYKDSFRKDIVFSLASYVIMSATTLIVGFLIIFLDVDSRYYYLKILRNIKSDII